MATPGPRHASPIHLFETLHGYQRTAAIKAAIELDLFTMIREGASGVSELALRCNASERGIRALCDYLVVQEFLAKDQNLYSLTMDSALFLDRGSPAYLGSIAGFLASQAVLDRFRDFAAVVRSGGPSEQESGLAGENPGWVDFARNMAPMMTPAAVEISKLLHADTGGKWKVLDIAAGHGVFGVTLAKDNPKAEIVAVDWPGVLEVARENAQRANVLERYRTIPGDAFAVEWGADFDIALITNFLHHFDIATNEAFLRKVHTSLAPAGRAVTLEFVPNEDRVSPPVPASFALTMLATTPAGNVYTLSEYREMFRNAGFSSCELHELPSSPQSLLIASK